MNLSLGRVLVEALLRAQSAEMTRQREAAGGEQADFRSPSDIGRPIFKIGENQDMNTENSVKPFNASDANAPITALRSLVKLKDHKDSNGKDRDYKRLQPVAWNVARDVVAHHDTLAVATPAPAVKPESVDPILNDAHGAAIARIKALHAEIAGIVGTDFQIDVAYLIARSRQAARFDAITRSQIPLSLDDLAVTIKRAEATIPAPAIDEATVKTAIKVQKIARELAERNTESMGTILIGGFRPLELRTEDLLVMSRALLNAAGRGE